MLHVSPLRSRHEDFARAAVGAIGTPTLRVGGPGSESRGTANRPGAAVGQKVLSTIEYLPFGIAAADGSPTCEVVASFGDVEAEYAAIRRGAGLFDSPHRGTIQVTGKDRQEFLNRMLTQELKDFSAGKVRETFWLNRTGRIDADLLLIELGDRTLIDVDIHQAAKTVRTLGEFQFAEDGEI